MDKFFSKLIEWRRGFSFFHLKIALFSLLVVGVMTNLFVKLDFQKWNFEYNNNDSSSVEIVVAIIVTCILFVRYNFLLEKARMSDRTEKEYLALIANPETPEQLRKELIKMLRSKY